LQVVLQDAQQRLQVIRTLQVLLAAHQPSSASCLLRREDAAVLGGETHPAVLGGETHPAKLQKLLKLCQPTALREPTLQRATVAAAGAAADAT
jgi:hypothetical protein